MYGAARAKHTCPCDTTSAWAQAAMKPPRLLVVCPCVPRLMCSHAHLRHARPHAHAVISRWFHVTPCKLDQHGPGWAWVGRESGVLPGTCPCRHGRACAQPGQAHRDVHLRVDDRCMEGCSAQQPPPCTNKHLLAVHGHSTGAQWCIMEAHIPALWVHHAHHLLSYLVHDMLCMAHACRHAPCIPERCTYSSCTAALIDVGKRTY